MLPIVVRRAPLHVATYAEDGMATTEASYGALDQLSYEIAYRQEDFKHADGPETFTKGHGRLEVVALSPMLEANSTPYAIGISKVGAELKIGEQTYQNVFFSRNYSLDLDYGALNVKPAVLQVRGDEITSQWSKEPAYTYSVSDFAAWDSEDTVFEAKPVAALDRSKHRGLIMPSLSRATTCRRSVSRQEY